MLEITKFIYKKMYRKPMGVRVLVSMDGFTYSEVQHTGRLRIDETGG